MMMLRFLHSFQVFLELFCYYKSYISLTCVNVSRFFVFSPECAPVSSSFFENNRSHRECLAFTRQGNKAPPSYLPRKKRHQSSLLLPPFQKRTNPAQPSVSGWAATDPASLRWWLIFRECPPPSPPPHSSGQREGESYSSPNILFIAGALGLGLFCRIRERGNRAAKLRKSLIC